MGGGGGGGGLDSRLAKLFACLPSTLLEMAFDSDLVRRRTEAVPSTKSASPSVTAAPIVASSSSAGSASVFGHTASRKVSSKRDASAVDSRRAINKADEVWV